MSAPSPTPRFTVTALCGKVVRSQTRTQAGSAMVLADRLFREGFQDIFVTGLDGIRREREAFRRTLPVVKRLGLTRRPPHQALQPD